MGHYGYWDESELWFTFILICPLIIYFQNALLYIYKMISNNFYFLTHRKKGAKLLQDSQSTKQYPVIPHTTGWTTNTKLQCVMLGLLTRNASYMEITKHPEKFQVGCV
jgi:hypothetical protein